MLITALLLPVCIFIFLKVFGKNHFAVKPLYQEEVPAYASVCKPVLTPYTVDTTWLKKMNVAHDGITMIYYDDAHNHRSSQNQLTRVREKFNAGGVTIVTIDGHHAYDSLRNCVLLLQGDSNTVLLNRKGIIYGQYMLHNREEADRLIMELDILLENY